MTSRWLRWVLCAGMTITLMEALGHGDRPAGAQGAFSLSFDGADDFVRTANLPALASFTVEAWVKRTADSNTYESFLSDANGDYSQATFTLFVDGGNADCGGGDQFAFYQSGSAVQCTGVSATLNNWFHVAVSRDSAGTRRLFINGLVRSSVANSPISADSLGTLTFGRAGDFNGEYFPGLLDEIRISDIAVYTSNFTPPVGPLSVTANTLGLWSLNEGGGQTPADRSGHNRHGTLGVGSGADSADPLWVTDSPGGATPTPGPSATATSPATATPTRTLTSIPPTPTRTPTRTVTPAITNTPVAGGASLRFYGHGINDVDRVKIQIDNPANSNPGPPADIGATDFTIEFWMKGTAAENPAGAVSCGNNVNWIYGNILIDRDRYNQDRKFGLSIAGGRVVFGVSGNGTGDQTICGTRNVLDGQWHHVAVQRRRSDGWLWLFVDGALEAQANGPDGDVSYPDNGVPGNFCGGPCTNSDPYLVLGAEKHDAGSSYPSFSGWLDELRLSRVLRYTGAFTRPTVPFTPDANTVALYHFDEAANGACTGLVLDASGAAGGPSNGACRYGGATPAGPVYSSDPPF